jgi:hypothetical protein
MPQGPIAVRVTNSAAIGNSWFVNESTGNDNYPGNAQLPFATLPAAQNAAVANNNDVVYLMGTSHQSATLNWAKNGVSLVGLSAPSDNDRGRISVADSLTQIQWTAFGPLVNVTAEGCSFVNLGTFYGYGASSLTAPTTPICWEEAGGRNFYSNVQFLGGGDANVAAAAAMRSLTIGGAGENLFVGCTFGLDTIERINNANATIEIVGGSPRNIIRSSAFQCWNGLAGNVHVLVQSGGMDRYLWLDDCLLHSFGTAMTAAISNALGSPNGDVILSPNCISIGANSIAASSSQIWVGQLSTAAPTTNNIGIPAS